MPKYQPLANVSTGFGPCVGRGTKGQFEYRVTHDLDDGQPCPPYYEGVPWRAVHRLNGRTVWCRISLSPEALSS